MVQKLKEDANLPIEYPKIRDPDLGTIFKNFLLAINDLWRELVEKVNPNLHRHPSHADATLSGTEKIFEVEDEDGTVYYFKGSPTKS